jgi:hypothetical protein
MIGVKGGPDLAGGGTGVSRDRLLGKGWTQPTTLGGGNASQGRQHDKQGCLGWAALFFLTGPGGLGRIFRCTLHWSSRWLGALLAATEQRYSSMGVAETHRHCPCSLQSGDHSTSMA